MEEKVLVESIKGQFVPAEFELLTDWSVVIEREAKGSGWVYLQLQVGINRDPDNKNYGKSWLSLEKLAQRCGATRQWVAERIKVLEKYGFIKTRRESHQNIVYTILLIPSYQDFIGRDKIVVSMQEIKSNPKQNIDRIFNADKVLEVIGKKYKNNLKRLDKKEISTWNTDDIIEYFRSNYFLAYEIEYPEQITMKERGQYRRFIDEYNSELVVLCINYALDTWQSMKSTSGYPTLSGIYAYRKSIVPEAKLGLLSRRKEGQHTGKVTLGGFRWN